MKIDKRLQTIADMIKDSKMILDVGTDHGYLCSYLVQNKKAELGIASDISKSSLQKAIDLLEKENMGGKIQCRLGAGLKVIDKDDKVDTIVISGMGGILISEIIEADKILIQKTKPILILQPVQKPEIIRRYLINNDYLILEETLVESEKKIYNIIKTIYKGTKDIDYESDYFEIGKYTNKDSTYYKQLNFLIDKYETVVNSMKKSDEISEKDIENKEVYIQFLKELKNYEAKEN
ncbi:MAG: tRNA (adenine(22)-N(1))-methyltransferase [Filifactoraceae bacterium]